MVVNSNRSLIDDSTARSILFCAAAGGFFLAGVWVTKLASSPTYNPAIFPAVFLVIALLAVTTWLQAYYHGSTILGFALIMAGPLGVFVPANPLHKLPIWGVILLGLPMTVTFFFGGLGHLCGSQFAKHHEAACDPSTVGQLVIATATFGLVGLQILDILVGIPII